MVSVDQLNEWAKKGNRFLLYKMIEIPLQNTKEFLKLLRKTTKDGVLKIECKAALADLKDFEKSIERVKERLWKLKHDIQK